MFWPDLILDTILNLDTLGLKCGFDAKNWLKLTKTGKNRINWKKLKVPKVFWPDWRSRKWRPVRPRPWPFRPEYLLPLLTQKMRCRSETFDAFFLLLLLSIFFITTFKYLLLFIVHSDHWFFAFLLYNIVKIKI